MEANIEIAQSLFKQNKYQETIDICKQILSTDSHSIEILKLIAKSFLAIRNIDDARLYFHKSLALKSDDFESIKDLGNTYLAIGDFNTAKSYFPKDKAQTNLHNWARFKKNIQILSVVCISSGFVNLRIKIKA